VDPLNLPINKAPQCSNGRLSPPAKSMEDAGPHVESSPRDISDIGAGGESSAGRVKPDLWLYSRPPGEKEKEVTFLFYLNGQFGDLEQATASSMLGLEQVGSDENVNIVAQLGRAPQREAHPAGGFDRIDNDWSGVRRYYVIKSDKPSRDQVSLKEWQKISREIPDNPLAHYTLGDAYTRLGYETKALSSYDKARELGYEKFLDSPFHPDVARWGNEFDKSIQPLRDLRSQNNNFASPVEEFKNDVNMMHPNSLQDFISWGMSKYPAKHYVLVMAGHGGGWTGALKMSPSEVSMAVQAGVHNANQRNGRSDHMDAIVFNSCYMGNLESVHQMKDASDITIASQMSARTTVFHHWPQLLGKVQKVLEAGEDFNPREMAREFVEYFDRLGEENTKRPEMLRRSKETYLTLIALDNKKVENISKAWGQFAKEWKALGVPDHKIFKNIKNAKNYPSYAYSPEMMFDYGTLRDIGSIAINIINDPQMPPRLKKSCNQIRKALRDATIAEQHRGFNMEGSTGLTIWAPTNAADVALMKDKYQDRVPSFVQDTGWSDKMGEILRNIDGQKLGEFLQTIQMLGNLRKMLDVQGFSPQEINSMQFKADILEMEVTQLKKEMDLSEPPRENINLVLYDIEEYSNKKGELVAASAQKKEIPVNISPSKRTDDAVGRKIVKTIKDGIPLPGDQKTRRKLQEEVAQGIIDDSDKTTGMASGEFSNKLPPGTNM